MSGTVEPAGVLQLLSELQNAGLTLAHAQVLFLLYESPGVSVNDVSELLEMPQQSASRIISQLSGRYEISPGRQPVELVRHEVGREDTRKRALYLTTAGNALVTKITASLRGKK